MVSYIPYKKVGEGAVHHIRTKLEKIYNNEDGVANGIAIEYGSVVYIVDSGMENGELTFGVRRIRIISDARYRADFTRRINNDTVSKKYLSDGLSSRIENGLGGASGRGMRRESRAELSADQGESSNIQGRISGEDADNGGLNSSDDTLRFKLSEKSEQKKYSYELTGNKVKKLANATGLKVYSKAEAEEIINHVLENYVVFGDAYGTLSGKSAAEAVDMLLRDYAKKRKGLSQ